MTAPRDRVIFYLNGQRCEAAGADALLTVSDYLRERRRMVGTKIVCSEGDCGSCTVLEGRPVDDRPGGARLRYLPIDSCIRFVFQLDGAHLVTVEGLADAGRLTPVQQAMVDCHGSQCGFCTPGFVMAMTGVVENQNGAAPDRDAWREALTGNLCRCTGYEQILEAGEGASEQDSDSLADRYPAGPILAESKRLCDEPLDIAAGAIRVYSPVTLGDALRFRNENPGCCVVAGATDLGVQRNKGRINPEVYLDLNRVDELASLELVDAGTAIVAGAGANWTSLLELCRRELPEFAKILSVFGSPQIRHAGTIGGNLINASPIADSLPLLFVFEAQLTLASAGGERVVGVNDFYHGYKQFDLKPGELLTRIELPLPAPGDLLRLYKVSRRRDLDISTFTAAIRMRLDGDTIAEARIAYGAVGPTVLRLPETEAMLAGQPFTAETMRAAGDAAVDEITPITDVRGAADYRFGLARNVLLKFHAEHQAGLLTA